MKISFLQKMGLPETLGARLITGVVLAAILLLVWVFGSWLLFFLVAVVAAAGQWECYRFFLPAQSWPVMALGMGLGFVMLLTSWLQPGASVAALMGAAMVILALHSLLGWQPERARAHLTQCVILAGGLVYVPFLLAPALHFSAAEQLLVVAVPALSDMMAYFAGVSLGKHKIWPAVSPKKSVEGAVAGLGAAVVTSVVLGLFWGAEVPESAFWWSRFAWLGLVMGIMAQMGDFFESALKRTVHVKDSSNLLPGHGGVLDRLDSILFAIATYALCSQFQTFF